MISPARLLFLNHDVSAKGLRLACPAAASILMRMKARNNGRLDFTAACSRRPCRGEFGGHRLADDERRAVHVQGGARAPMDGRRRLPF